MAEAVRQKSRHKKKKNHIVPKEENPPLWQEVDSERVTTTKELQDEDVTDLASKDKNSAATTSDVSSIPAGEVSNADTTEDPTMEGEEIQCEKDYETVESTELQISTINHNGFQADESISDERTKDKGEGEDSIIAKEDVIIEENDKMGKDECLERNVPQVVNEEISIVEVGGVSRDLMEGISDSKDGNEKRNVASNSKDSDVLQMVDEEEMGSSVQGGVLSTKLTERISQVDKQSNSLVQLLEEEEKTEAVDARRPYDAESSSHENNQIIYGANKQETNVHDKLVKPKIKELNLHPQELQRDISEASNLMDAMIDGAVYTDISAVPLVQTSENINDSTTDVPKQEEFEVLEPQPTGMELRSMVDPTAPDLLANTLNSSTRSVSREPTPLQTWDSNSRFTTLRSISMSGVRFGEQRERTLTPMTENDLKYYYFNHMIQNKEDHIEQFLKECRIERHHFFELVYNYYRARGNLLTVMKDVEKNQALYKEKAENCWHLTESEIPIKGVCADKLTVASVISTEKAEFRQNILKELETTLSSIRDCVHETFALCAYTAQLSKLQIESYIHILLQSSPLLCGLESHMPCTSHMQLVGDPQTTHCIQELKDCISVLFSFQRRPVVDTEFMESSRQWLDRLVSYLLRVATYEDHFFILNHLIRCPPGLDSWAVSFLQLTFAGGPQQGVGDWWGSPKLDHFVHMLAVLMFPAKSRDELLIRMKQAITPDTPPSDALLNWTLLDEDGEEDETTTDLPLNEGDLVALLTQYPFDELFKNVLVLPELGSTSGQPVDAKHIMRLIAFSTTILKIFHEGLKTYNRSRYRQFVKRIGRLIRHTVQYVSAQWTQLRTSSEDIVEGYGPLNSMYMEQLSFARLQVEMDELFFRAVQCIMSSPRLGTWQFLADMPYTCLSGGMMWRLYWYLHSSFMGWADKTHVKDEAKPADYEWWLADFSNRSMFCKKLLDMPMSEVIYLLTTFANMATSRGMDEEPFIRFVAKELYQITYVNNELREQLSKTGRELLYTVTACHPFTLSHLLMELEQTMDTVGNMVLFLFSHLALHLLKPTPQDFERLHSWLLHFGPDTIQSKLSRLVLTKLNWGVDEESKTLVLDLHLHRNVAILLVEAHCKHFADKNRAGYQGVLQWNLSKFTYNIENFDFWAWDLMIKLRLHQQCQPYFDEAESRSLYPESSSHWSVSNVATDSALYPVQRGIKDNIPLACYVTIAMTETGHNLEQFLSLGLDCLQVLATTGYQRLCIPLLAIIVPMFMEEGHPDYLLSNDSFLSNVKSILAADFHNARFAQRLMGSVPGETTKLFANMIMCLLQERFASSSDKLASSMVHRPTPTSMLEFWLSVLTSNPAWSTDLDHCYVLDQLLKLAFCQIKDGTMIAVEAILQQYKTTKPEPRQGFLSSVLSLALSGSQMVSFLTAHNMKYTWLAYIILLAETKFLESREVMKGVIHEMQRNVDMPPETALKKACNKMKLDFTLSIQTLPIYRWSQLALETELNHPLMPIVWQKFFISYLQRYFSNSDITRRTSLGPRFFQSMANNAFLKKLKHHLGKIADFHHSAGFTTITPKDDEEALSVSPVPSAPSEDEVMEGLYGPSTIQGAEAASDENTSNEAKALSTILERDSHMKLVRLYQTFSFWLEEPLLHDPGLYLPSLPEQYEAEKLQVLFNGEQEPWHEFVNYDRLSIEIMAQIITWLGHVKPSYHDQSQRSTTLIEQTAIVRNLELQSDRPKPPPLIPMVKAPVPDTPYELLTDHVELWNYLKPQLKTMNEFASSISSRSSMHVALDLNYVELLPSMYYHDEEQKTVRLSCKATCKGPSTVSVRYTVKKMSDMTNRQLRQNRAEYAQVIIASRAPPPLSICMAAVHMENIITELIKSYRLSSDPDNAFRQTGESLFYHMASQFNEDTKHYPPTRQFLTSCIEVLGEDFIKPSPHQAQPLLQTILNTPQLSEILSPTFCPNKCPSLFVEMYKQVVIASKLDSKDLGFMLLSKFHVQNWILDSHPDKGSCLELISHIGDALRGCGKDDDVVTALQHFDIYRNHFQFMLLYRFPNHFDAVLRILLEGSSVQELHTFVWKDSLRTLNCDILKMKEEVSYDDLARLVKEEQILSLQQLHETVEMLGGYFTSSRQQHPASFQFGLFSQWSYCIEPLISFIASMVINYASQEINRILDLDVGQQQAVLNLWSSLCTLFSPWLRPLTPASGIQEVQILSPWSSGDEVAASCMMKMFIHCIRSCHQQLIEQYTPSTSVLLNLTWNYYVTELSLTGVPSYVLDVYHKELVSLPWGDFSPDLTNMKSMVQIYDAKASDLSLMFLADVFQQIKWKDILHTRCQRSDEEGLRIASQTVSYLLNLLIIFANQMSLTQSEGRNLVQLFEEAEHFPWSFLDDVSFNTAVSWLLEQSNPACVFQQQSYNLRLMRAVAGMGPSSPPEDFSVMKQRSYINMAVGLLCKCSERRDIRQNDFIQPVQQLLKDIQIYASRGGDSAESSAEVVHLLSIVVALLNNASPRYGVPQTILKAMKSWLYACSDSRMALNMVKASCISIASTAFMADIVELSLEAHFKSDNFSPAEDTSHGWAPVLSVLQLPELSHDAFVAECKGSNAFLTLFAYITQQLPLCKSVDDEYVLLCKLSNWSAICKLSPSSEHEIFLWCHKSLELCNRLVQFGIPQWKITPALATFATFLSQNGEDRSSSGLLGVIGLGSKSDLSIKFRLSARCIASFILAQLPQDGKLRQVAHDPGAINVPVHASPNHNIPRPSTSAKDALKALDAAISSKGYASLKAYAQSIKLIILDPTKSIMDAPWLVAKLVTDLFPDFHCLDLVRNS